MIWNMLAIRATQQKYYFYEWFMRSVNEQYGRLQNCCHFGHQLHKIWHVVLIFGGDSPTQVENDGTNFSGHGIDNVFFATSRWTYQTNRFDFFKIQWTHSKNP